MTEKSLKSTALSGMFWNGIQKYSILIVSFVSSIILARLLTPYDYGCIGMLEIFIAVATIIIDGGFGSALIQKKRPTQEDYSTIFYWNLFMSGVFYVFLFISAPFIADFYKIPILSQVLRVQGIVLFINALKMIQSNQLRKQFRFRPIAVIVISSSIVSMVATIVMAYMGFGVWSLVIQNLLISLLPMIGFEVVTGWIPSRLFSMKSFKELFSFGGFMFLTDIVNTVSDNLQGLLIGRVYTPAIMGYYAKAKTTEALASNGISQVVSGVTYQLYSEVQDQMERLSNMIKQFSISLAYLTFPIIISLLILAEPLFVILYSDRWLPSVPYFRILAFGGFAICLQAVNLQAIAAIGKSKATFYWTLTKRILGIILLIVGLFIGGIEGLLWSMVISSWIAFFINSWLVSKYIGYNIRKQIIDLLPVVLLTVFALIPVAFFRLFCTFGTNIDAVVMFLIFIASYLILSISLNIEAYRFCKSLMPLLTNKIRRKK